MLFTGKNAPKFSEKTLYMHHYILPDAPPLPPIPEKTFWEYKVDPSKIGMYGNDVAGDCTFAAVAHAIIEFTAHTGNVFFPDPADIIKAYSDLTGYDPSQTDWNGDNPTDNGAAITDVLNYWQTKGIAGHKILGWAQLDHTNLLRRRQGIYIFGGNDVGVQLPLSAMRQFDDGRNWELIQGEKGKDGHCIWENGIGSEGSNFQSWGKGDQKAGAPWSAAFMDEAYVVMTADWLKNADGLAPNMLDLDKLTAALKAITA